MNSKYINDILLDYERNKSAAEEASRKRRFEVYQRIPRIKQIDTELSSMGIEIAKSVLSKDVNVDKLIDTLKHKSIDLKMEKGELLTQNDIPLDYTEPLYRCGDCKDTGYIGSKKCHCFRQKIINMYYNQSNLKNILSRENFDTFVFDYYSGKRYEDEPTSPRRNMEDIFSACVNFVRDFDSTNENLFFYGSSGLGKTFLSNCIAKDLLDKGKVVIYQTAPNLLEILKDFEFNSTNDSIRDKVNNLFNCDLLILDDLGTEYYKTEFTQMELYNIINRRLITEKKMLISTNLHLDELLKAYAERLTSRILGSFTIYKFYGDDIRLKIRQQKRKGNKK